MIRLRKMGLEDLPLFKAWLSAPHVARWYHDPQDWIGEVEQQDGAFRWLHHFIVEQEDRPIGFCQYYACKDSGEDWGGYTALGGTYSIDYLIGETQYLGKGVGKQIVAELTERIMGRGDAERIVGQPEPENRASCGLLLSCGFVFDPEKEIYVKRLS